MGLFIKNTFVESVNKKQYETINPSTRKICNGKEHGRLLNKLADLIERDLEELAAIESFDNGQTLFTAKFIDVGLSIDCYRYFAR
ncbi:hypothetical protein C2G38_2231727 [Gigaspora rosea]|uniref:Aldehyde dehydrogenase domain-containing protein n=1 Tax=Gigaspora rosea TaxID=44941 RepID=A0A397U253_9GLOM|nr:hypothetical protein C2G38_2231727 [Gigaspora rosea]